MITNPYQSLVPLFDEKSAVDRIEDFHTHINIIFHDVESKYYDHIHKEMWDNLQEQFNKLVDGIQVEATPLSTELNLLDIGCGTGLSTEMTLKTALGRNIKTISLLDTSSQMLEKAKARIEKWQKPITLLNTEVNNITSTFDVIVICSVIHHIPDLNSFFAAVKERLNSGGILITMHDPFAEAIESSIFKTRINEYHDVQKKQQSFLPRRIVKRIKNKLQFLLPKSDPIAEVNELLLSKKIVKAPLSHTEIWSVTDIHVEDLPYSNQKGVSLTVLKSILKGLTLKKLVTYCFYGSLKSDLIKSYRLKEEILSRENDQYGRNFGTIWIKENKNV